MLETIKNKRVYTRCLIKEAKVNRMIWPEVVKAAAYLKNRALANTITKSWHFK
jgi:hypothetical protein